MKATKLLLLLLVILYGSSCKKKDTDCTSCPAVKSLTPNKGFKGDTIILVGKNFSSELHANIVKFNETTVPAADIISGNTNQLKVRVPDNCGTGPVSVYITDDLFSAPGPVFNYEYGSIASFLPATGRKGDTITIIGEKFSPAQNTVKFNGQKALLVSESDTLIKAIVPVNCGTGLITITLTNGLTIKSVTDFIYTYTYTVSTYAGVPKTEGALDGPLASATFKSLQGIGIDYKSRTIFVSDANCIRKINNGQVSTFVGDQATSGHADGYGKAARLGTVNNIAVNSSGELFIPDVINNCIRKIIPAGYVSTFCGKGKQMGDQDGKGSNALFSLPTSLQLYNDSILFIADTHTGKIRRCNMKAEVKTIPGISTSSSPRMMVKDDHTLLGTEFIKNQLMKIDLVSSQVSIFAGSGQNGVTDGDLLTASFSNPMGIAMRIVQGKQQIYVIDNGSHLIRMIDHNNRVSTVMGSTSGYVDGENRNALFNQPTGLAFDPANNNILYILDAGNKIIRKVIID